MQNVYGDNSKTFFFERHKIFWGRRTRRRTIDKSENKDDWKSSWNHCKWWQCNSGNDERCIKHLQGNDRLRSKLSVVNYYWQQDSLLFRQFLSRNEVCVVIHPPYSLDLAGTIICDFLFSKVKIKLKGCFD